MPKVNVYDMQGKIVEEIELDSNIFGVEVNTHCMHMAVVNNLANKRQGTHSTLVKSEVSGGGKKPYRQKGTGRARQGSTRSAQWIHGGIVFGPKPRDYSYTIPKKVKRLALKSSLSSKAIDGDIVVLDKLSFEEIKTKKEKLQEKAMALATKVYENVQKEQQAQQENNTDNNNDNNNDDNVADATYEEK